MQSEAPLVLPVTLLRSLMTCERRVWLDVHGDLSRRTDASTGQLERFASGVDHEARIHAATSSGMRSVEVANWNEGVQATKRAIQQGLRIILGGYFEAPVYLDGSEREIILRGRIDRLEQRGSRNGKALYIPVEIKMYRTLSQADQIQLDAYCWLLEQIQGVAPRFGQFWLGARDDGRPERILHHDYDEMRLWTAFERLGQLLANDLNMPPVHIISHCKECPWYTACLSEAVMTHDVSLLSGLHKNTRMHFQNAGIISLQQIVSMSVIELRQFKNIGAATAPNILAQAQAWIEQRPIWLQPLPDIYRQESWFFDIETNPATGEIWSIGWSREDEPIQLVVVAPHLRNSQQVMLPNGQIVNLAPNTDAAWRCFAASLSIDEQPIFHWTGFDAGVMRATAPEDVIERLNHRLHDFHGSFKKAVQLPADGTSLKTVAAYFGFAWSEYADWRMAWSDYQRWLVTENDDYLAKACTYQGDDVRAMVVVRDWCQTTETDISA
jgi:predicted RecB family nuclease